MQSCMESDQIKGPPYCIAFCEFFLAMYITLVVNTNITLIIMKESTAPDLGSCVFYELINLGNACWSCRD